MYAVIETGGKQYKVEVGQTVDVELIPAEIGDKVELGRVLMVSTDKGIRWAILWCREAGYGQRGAPGQRQEDNRLSIQAEDSVPQEDGHRQSFTRGRHR